MGLLELFTYQKTNFAQNHVGNFHIPLHQKNQSIAFNIGNNMFGLNSFENKQAVWD